MAKVHTPPKQPDLTLIGLDEVSGLEKDDRAELRLVKIRNLAQLVQALEVNGWDISQLNTEDVYFSAQQAERIAASVAKRNDTPERPEVLKVEEEPDLNLVSIRSMGISGDELDEWRYHGIGSLANAYNMMLRVNGDFTVLSDGVVVIESAQSDAFGDLLLAHPLCPADIKEKFLPSRPIKVEVQAQQPAPRPQPAPKAKAQPTVPQHLKVEVHPAPKPMAPRPQAQQTQATPPAPQETVFHAALAGVVQVLTFGRIKL